MHESILNIPIALPIHTANLYNVTNFWNALFKVTGNYTVYWEYHNGTATLSPFVYADVAAYTAFQLNRHSNTTGVAEMVALLNTMWDGKGMVDEPFKNGSGIYQTYKDALYLLVLTRLSMAIPAGLADSFLRMQGPDGGFHTGYSSTLTYGGTDENAETTSIAIIALSEQLPGPSFNALFLSIVPERAILLQLVLAALRRRSTRSTTD